MPAQWLESLNSIEAGAGEGRRSRRRVLRLARGSGAKKGANLGYCRPRGWKLLSGRGEGASFLSVEGGSRFIGWGRIWSQIRAAAGWRHGRPRCWGVNRRQMISRGVRMTHFDPGERRGDLWSWMEKKSRVEGGFWREIGTGKDKGSEKWNPVGKGNLRVKNPRHSGR